MKIHIFIKMIEGVRFKHRFVLSFKYYYKGYIEINI